jgi:hypothetical protein
MASVLVPACLESDFDAATGTCAAPIWIPQPSIVPELTIEDAQALGLAFAGLWALAFVLRRIRKFVDQA